MIFRNPNLPKFNLQIYTLNLKDETNLNFILLIIQDFFFLSGFFFTDTGNSQDSRERERRTIFYSTLPLPPTHEHSHIYFQLCTWDGYHKFLIATLVIIRLLLNEIYHLIDLLFDWLIIWYWILFTCLLNWF